MHVFFQVDLFSVDTENVVYIVPQLNYLFRSVLYFIFEINYFD